MIFKSNHLAGIAEYTTAARNALTPFGKDIIYNTDTGAYNYWDGAAWHEMGGSSAPVVETFTATGTIGATTDIVFVDCSASNFTLLLPASPSNGKTISLIRIDADTSNNGINGNGKTVNGSSIVYVAGQRFCRFVLTFDSADNDWKGSLITGGTSQVVILGGQDLGFGQELVIGNTNATIGRGTAIKAGPDVIGGFHRLGKVGGFNPGTVSGADSITNGLDTDKTIGLGDKYAVMSGSESQGVDDNQRFYYRADIRSNDVQFQLLSPYDYPRGLVCVHNLYQGREYQFQVLDESSNVIYATRDKDDVAFFKATYTDEGYVWKRIMRDAGTGIIIKAEFDNLDGYSAGTDFVIVPRKAGHKFCVTRAYVTVVACDGPPDTSNPYVSLGITGNPSELVSSFEVTDWDIDDVNEMTPLNVREKGIGSSDVICRVSTAASSGTTSQARIKVIVEGYYTVPYYSA